MDQAISEVLNQARRTKKPVRVTFDGNIAVAKYLQCMFRKNQVEMSKPQLNTLAVVSLGIWPQNERNVRFKCTDECMDEALRCFLLVHGDHIITAELIK
jgi:hypothetical protein